MELLRSVQTLWTGSRIFHIPAAVEWHFRCQLDKITDIVDEVERKIRAVGGTEVSSQLIGEYVMNILADVDDVTYIRFASVYHEFKDMQSFADELQELMKRNKQK